MILSFVIISYESGGVLFARHYGASLATESAQATWMRRLHAATAADWGLLRSEGEEQVATLGGAEAAVQVLYKLLGDVVLLLAGDEEHDALLLLEVARALDGCLRGACRIPRARDGTTRVSAEGRLLATYHRLCLVVDEVIVDGEVDHLDRKRVLKLIDMKPRR
ncbi:hypothetical protein BU14_0196s0011 [Porphyra umbilicalis]|uniref:Uncharacterized protein n=1 Tax=Porphyra umbilicalis TaxID=2786 RepID=A0A1X6P678_PORUM|nr:hypothetical protein BU14_0196s0011 [Porphyra umbilicalis]|eukprot:OSX76344.1 hypothetical protein BU14_0196s0011 [Porphyra umbilicalis]